MVGFILRRFVSRVSGSSQSSYAKKYRIVSSQSISGFAFTKRDVMRNIQKDLTYPKRADNLRITHQFVARLARGFARVHAP